MDPFAAGPELAANALAFVVAEGADRLLTTRRVVHRWQDVEQAERVALFALLDQLGVKDGSLRFELETVGRWYMRIDRGGSVFAGLPAESLAGFASPPSGLAPLPSALLVVDADDFFARLSVA